MHVKQLLTVDEIGRINPISKRLSDSDKIQVQLARETLAQKYNSSSFDDDWITFYSHKGEIIASPKCDDRDIAAIYRKIYRDLTVLYKIKQSNRSRIVSQIKTLCGEINPGFVTRTDIRAFYSSVNTGAIIEKLHDDGLLCGLAIKFIEWTISKCRAKGIQGLPRGIAFSALLAELYLRDFDRKIRDINNVYYYARFVDDVIIFHIKEFSDAVTMLQAMLPAGLVIHPDKTNSNAKLPLQSSIEYLGYKFVVVKKQLLVLLADKKIKKVQARIDFSIARYKIDKDFRMLDLRLKYLTTNYNRSASKYGILKAGIYYNYPQLSDNALIPLDTFMKGRIHGLYKWASKHIPEEKNKINELRSFSFSIGWGKRFVSKFTRLQMMDIKKAWAYE